LSYEQFVVPLVKAVQEQQVIITELQRQVLELNASLQDHALYKARMVGQQNQIEVLMSRIVALENNKQ